MNERDLKVVVKMIVGSKMYGTDNENSDTDYKGVYMPSKTQLLLGEYLDKAPKSIHFDTGKNGVKNTKDDIDCEYYSLHYFLKMLESGQTCAIEMLFNNVENNISTSEEWDYLVANRHKFLTKEMKSFLGYARTQASKYSAKGDRMTAIENVNKVLLDNMPNYMPSGVYLKTIWDKLYVGNHVRKYVEPRNNANMYEVCGRKFEDTSSIEYVSSQLSKVYDGYGVRAKQAKLGKGVDWKAVSHAFRIGYQLEELLTTEDLKYPLKQSEFLKQVKEGKLDFNKDKLDEKLEELLEKIETLSETNKLPEKVNLEPFKEWLISLYNN